MCWRLILILLFALVLVTRAAAATPAASAQTPDEVAVLAADERQREAVAAVDLPAIAAISHPDLLINAPNNRVITRDDLIRMVGSGEIRNEIFERVPETVSVTGDVAIVMGHETVFPGADSEQARMYGRRTLNRRYTNVYLRVAGTWLHLARHANVLR
ncbi:MAG: nuclear transport factor 2 family protein [Allosphingosinicella sp.]